MEFICDAETRREQILKELAGKGTVRVNDLSEKMGISKVTIRSDLATLEKQGLLQRVHGGAISRSKTYYHLSLLSHMETHVTEKRAIAKACKALVSDGDTIMINAGSTSTLIMKELASHKALTVLTNSLWIARDAELYDQMNIILLGGTLSQQGQYSYGEDTIKQLQQYRASKAILAVDGITPEEISTEQRPEFPVLRCMMERANTTIVAADSSKLMHRAFTQIETLDKVHCVVTDTQAPQQALDQIRKTGVQIVLA